MSSDNYSSFTREDLRLLDLAIASGELRIKHEDRLVEYRDLDEMLRVRQLVADALQADEAAKSGATVRGRRRSFRLVASDGL